jgi:muramoyltetrapeptide carboxypeptidase
MKKIIPGSKIGIIAPAFPPDGERLRNGIDYLLKMGYSVEPGKSLSAQHGYFAGTDSLRLDDLHRMYEDFTIDAILCARGGWGTLRMLDKLDYVSIEKNAKLLIGYSDITTLQLAIWTKTGLPSLSGPMAAVEMGTGILDFTEQHFWDQIENNNNWYAFYFDNEEISIWNNGSASGTLLGGCLSMVAHQLGTPYSPDYKDAILFLEDVGEEPYKIDRYLAQLDQAEILNKVNAVILGNFLDCKNDDTKRKSFTVEEVLKDYFSKRDYPVIYNFPYGHGMRKMSMPIGVQTRLNTKQNLVEFANLFKQQKAK